MQLVRMGKTPAADGHAVVLNPRPVGKCSFAEGDTRTWTSTDDVVEGVCGAKATHRLCTASANDTELCGSHAAHVRTCPECSPQVAYLNPLNVAAPTF